MAKQKIDKEMMEQVKILEAATREKLGDKEDPESVTKAMFETLFEAGEYKGSREEAMHTHLMLSVHEAKKSMAFAGLMMMMKEDDIPEDIQDLFKKMISDCVMLCATIDMIDEESKK